MKLILFIFFITVIQSYSDPITKQGLKPVCLKDPASTASLNFYSDSSHIMTIRADQKIEIVNGKGIVIIDTKTGHVSWNGKVPDAQARQFWDAIVIARKYIKEWPKDNSK